MVMISMTLLYILSLSYMSVQNYINTVEYNFNRENSSYLHIMDY